MVKNMPKPRSETGDKNFISDRLKSLRKEHHMSQRELATRLGISKREVDMFAGVLDARWKDCV